MFGLGRDHRVPERPETVGSVGLGTLQKVGKPMSHSTKAGLSRRVEVLGDSAPVGIGSGRPRRYGLVSQSSIPGHGQSCACEPCRLQR